MTSVLPADPGRRAEHAARVAKARDPGLVQQMGVDARDLRGDVGAHAEEAPRHRIDDLEGQQVEIVTGTRQQRFEVLDQRRLDKAETLRAEVVEQRAAQRLHPLGLHRQDVLDVLRQDPLTHDERASSRRARGRSRRAR